MKNRREKNQERKENKEEWISGQQKKEKYKNDEKTKNKN